MQAVRVIVFTVALLLSTGCSGALPLENGDVAARTTSDGAANPTTPAPRHGCGGSMIGLSAVCKGAASSLAK